MTGTDHLWGGILTSIQFDPTSRVLELAIRVEAAGEKHRWTVRLNDVSDLRVDRPDDGWDYTEVTEVHVSPDGDRNQVEFVFWAAPNGLSASFSMLSVERQR